MDFAKFCELFPKAAFVKIAPFNEEELTNEVVRKHNKQPLNSLKDPLTVPQAENWVSHGGRLGWIIPKGYIVIDIDNKDHIRSAEVTETLLNNHSVKYYVNYSKQGTHFVFKNTSAVMQKKSQFQGYINHIGIQCDGRGENKGYIILPSNDEPIGRRWGDWTAEDIDDLPFWLRPVRPRKDSDVSFIDMPEGTGNEALFRLRGTHTIPNLVTAEESVECLRIINLEIWDDPMPEETFEATVARPLEKTYGNMQSQTGQGSSGKKSWLPIAKKLIEEQNLIAVGDFVYQWNNGVYEKLSPYELHELIHTVGDPEATRSQRQEVIEFIIVEKQVNPLTLDKEYSCIPVANGYLDLYNLELIEPSKNQYNTVKVNIPFNEHCQFSERIDDFMKFIAKGDIDLMAQLYEIAGYSLLRRNSLHKFFVIVGPGGSGKSTYGNLIRRLFPAKLVSKVALSQFDQDYHLSTLIGSMLNIDDDASSEKLLKDAGRFKSITAGQPVLVRPIYSEPLELICMSTIIVLANSMPKIQDNSDGLYRRLMLVELTNKIKVPDRDFDNKITDLDMEYFLYKSAEAIHKVLRRGRFTLEETEESLKQKFKVQQSSINKWCQLEYITVDRLLNKGMKVIYGDYKNWCFMCGYNAFNYGNFTEAMITQYKLVLSYDKGLSDQIIVNSDYPLDYCPFDQSLRSYYV
jgi:putative DNA primase/helicase